MLLLSWFWRSRFFLSCAVSSINSAVDSAEGDVRDVRKAVRDAGTVQILRRKLNKVRKNKVRLRLCGLRRIL